jgi:hypothetical protein
VGRVHCLAGGGVSGCGWRGVGGWPRGIGLSLCRRLEYRTCWALACVAFGSAALRRPLRSHILTFFFEADQGSSALAFNLPFGWGLGVLFARYGTVLTFSWHLVGVSERRLALHKRSPTESLA